MDTFDIGRLTDFDFESVCKDIFEEILGVQLEIFSPGADQGIDLRHLKGNPTTSIIIQCKHWNRTDRNKLLSHMHRKELPKIHQLNPSRYILATSTELTKASKDSLVKSLYPFINPGDIYGLQEIESELRKRPHIVQRHLRLWLTSTAVLQGLLAKEVLIRSGSLIEELNRSLEFYVPNESFERAQRILESRRIVVISGLPGIGKTTLAQVLAANYISQGFELIEISADIEEANRLWDYDRKQMFYYDDFLGQTTIDDKLNKNEDSRLISLLRRVSSAPNKLFLLTTREYILNQAKQRYEKISNTDFSPMACVLDLADYTQRIRAQILYNHIYFSKLPYDHRAIFADPTVYLPIINHANFNPRLVHLSLDQFTGEETPDETPKRLLANLHNPRRLWEHIVDHQLDEYALAALEIIFSFGKEVAIDVLRKSWLAHVSPSTSTQKFRHSLQILEGTLIRINVRNGQQTVSFHNPSVRDYMREYLSNHPESVSQLVANAVFFDQLETLWSIGTGHKGSAIMSAMLADPQLLQDAISRVIESPNPQNGWYKSLVRRAGLFLQIANHIESIAIFKLVEERILKSLDVYVESDSGEDAVFLIEELYDSHFEDARSWAVDFIEEAFECIMGDLSDWEDMENADFLISRLGYISEARIQREVMTARSDLDTRMHNTAHEAFQLYLEDEWHGDPSRMQRIVDYVSSIPNRDNSFPSYQLIVDRLEQIQENTAEQTKPRHVHIFDEASSVQNILSALDERHD